MKRTIIHIDMDAFFAAVEVRDNPELAGKPLIIGALPHERGVVSTCSYEARRYGVHSAMSIKDAYKLCPHGIYMHGNMQKYKEASDTFHAIWASYTDIVEYISLDEGYLDVTGSLKAFGGAMEIAQEIKACTKREAGLSCSVGIGYSMMAAKLASEEKKPDGLFAIPNKESLLALIQDRGVRIIYGIGKKTAERLEAYGIQTVRDIRENRNIVIGMLGKQGRLITGLADGIDNRQVTSYKDSEAKSVGREHTFQQDITDRVYLKSVLKLIAKELSLKLRLSKIYCQTITLKVTFASMKQITRSKSGTPTSRAEDIYAVSAAALDGVEGRAIRLIGISVSGFTENALCQLSLGEFMDEKPKKARVTLDDSLLDLQKKYGADILKTGGELAAEEYLSAAEGRE